MFDAEFPIRARYEQLLREADHQRLVRQAAEGARTGGRAAVRSGADASGGRVSGRRGRRVRVRRAAA
jgi:hypothetical protein